MLAIYIIIQYQQHKLKKLAQQYVICSKSMTCEKFSIPVVSRKQANYFFVSWKKVGQQNRHIFIQYFTSNTVTVYEY